MEISIRITNAFTKEVEMDFKDSLAESSIDKAHELFTEAYPNSFVNFVWGEDEAKSFICGQPHNMKQDEIAQHAGLMSWDDYSGKWYSNKQNQ